MNYAHNAMIMSEYLHTLKLLQVNLDADEDSAHGLNSPRWLVGTRQWQPATSMIPPVDGIRFINLL